jgi:gas vesicle protein
MKIGKLVCSLLLATSAGLAIGLLAAPNKGSQTRKRIGQKTANLLEDEIIGYNRMICNVKDKLDEILTGLTISAGNSPRIWSDTDQKTEIII